MQKPEKSCSQCRARKTKCDRRPPRCSSCHARDLVCQFGLRQKPGPPKGFKKKECPGKNSHGSDNGSRQHRQCKSPEEPFLSKTPSGQSSPSNETHILLPDMRKSDCPFTMDQMAPEPTTSFDLLQTLEDPLVDAYSAMKLFPFLPHVSKQHLLDPEIHGTLRSALVNGVCAISAHSTSNAIFDYLPITRTKAAEMFATRARSAYLRYTREEDHPTSLTIIKVAAILAVYQMHCSPGIKGWSMVGEAVRLSYDMRLDQLDSKTHLTSTFMSVEEAEDARYLWWSIYSLDTYASSTLMRPFAITSNSINTALISTPEDQLKMGYVNPTQRVFLPSDLVELQMIVPSLNHRDPLSTQTLYLLILSFGRSMTDMRREQLDGIEVDAQSNLIQNTLFTLRFSIPDNFLDLQGDSSDMHLRLTRIEMVLLLELQTLCFYTYPSSRNPLEEPASTNPVLDPLGRSKFYGYFDGNPSVPSCNSWNSCIQRAFAIVKIVRNLSPQDLSRMSPTIAAIFWLPALTLILHYRSRTSAAERANTASGTEVLKAALKRMGNTWAVAQIFHDALAALGARPATAFTELHMQYFLQSYSSPLVSVSCGSNNVHIPSLMIPYLNQTEDSPSWTLFDEC